MNSSCIILLFFTYDSHIVYRLFLYILLSHCIYYTSHVIETWILLKSLCETCGQFIYLFPLRHVLFGSSSPYYCIICAISMCYICELYDVCYLHISDILMFCILFSVSVMYITQLFMYFMSIYWCIWTWQMIIQVFWNSLPLFVTVFYLNFTCSSFLLT